MSIMDFAHLGSSLSVRGCARFGSALSLDGAVHFGKAGTYIRSGVESYDSLELRAGGNRGLSVLNDGGILHGNWLMDSVLLTSDRRLKKSIEPLHKAMTQVAAAAETPGSPKTPADKTEGANWVLRELRPVSFKFKSGPEAKFSRFGFVAQELKQVLPNIVRTTDDKQHMAVVYQDLIALLTLATQNLEKSLVSLDEWARRQEERVKEREERLKKAKEHENKREEEIAALMRTIKELEAKIDED